MSSFFASLILTFFKAFIVKKRQIFIQKINNPPFLFCVPSKFSVRLQPNLICSVHVGKFLLYSTCDTFRKALLETEENDCGRNRTDKYTEHQYTIVYRVATEQVRYQHRHGNGIIVL